MKLPEHLYTAEATRRLDQLAIASGIPGMRLMERAGRAAFVVLKQRWPEARRIAVFCGAGNNGGDGYVIARLALEAGLEVHATALVPTAELRGDAALAAQTAIEAGVLVADADRACPFPPDVVVDGLLGTGLKGAPREHFAQVIQHINGLGVPVLAVDIPSGLNADTGAIAGDVVLAEATITFIALKQGLFTGAALSCRGVLYYDDLHVSGDVFAAVPVAADRPDAGRTAHILPPRVRSAHKGHFGHVLVMGGASGYAGAALMAAQAAGRCGAGLVSVATRPEHCQAIISRQPEVMAHGVNDEAALAALVARASTLIVGPGMGRSAWAESLLATAMQSSCPAVVDADALNLLAERSSLPHRRHWVLTPHPGEAARLLDMPVSEVEADRFSAVRRLAEMTGAAVVLKGAGTLVFQTGAPRPAVISYGNPGMASGGMGDVLSGVIGGLLAQGLEPLSAAIYGALLHAVSADHCAASYGERGLLATDLLPFLRRLLNGKDLKHVQ